jgi:hypothetical protein
MSDAGILLRIHSSDGRALGESERVRARAVVELVRQRSPGLAGELGQRPAWREVDMAPGVMSVVVFEHWGEDIDLNVLHPDGTITPPRFVRMIIDGEELEVPEASPPGNPDSDQMLMLILERDLARAQRAVVDAGIETELGDALAVEVVAEHW